VTHLGRGSVACVCCADLPQYDRRTVLGMAGSAGVLAAAHPLLALAAEGEYEAMVLSCIDPRLQEPVRKYTAGRGLIGKYSQFVIAGAAIGVVAPVFRDWHKAFWDNLGASIQLHRIRKVIAIDHRDCGAAKIAYGPAKVASPRLETQTHRAALAEFRIQVGKRYPKLAVETGLMSLDGTMEVFG